MPLDTSGPIIVSAGTSLFINKERIEREKQESFFHETYKPTSLLSSTPVIQIPQKSEAKFVGSNAHC